MKNINCRFSFIVGSKEREIWIKRPNSRGKYGHCYIPTHSSQQRFMVWFATNILTKEQQDFLEPYFHNYGTRIYIDIYQRTNMP